MLILNETPTLPGVTPFTNPTAKATTATATEQHHHHYYINMMKNRLEFGMMNENNNNEQLNTGERERILLTIWA